MSKHTPGPWQARTGRANTSVYVEGTQHAVAVGCKEPDARLIAAAPDMLEALREMLRQFEPANDLDDATPEMDDAVTLTRAAIAKATEEGNT